MPHVLATCSPCCSPSSSRGLSSFAPYVHRVHRCCSLLQAVEDPAESRAPAAQRLPEPDGLWHRPFGACLRGHVRDYPARWTPHSVQDPSPPGEDTEHRTNQAAFEPRLAAPPPPLLF